MRRTAVLAAAVHVCAGGAAPQRTIPGLGDVKGVFLKDGAVEAYKGIRFAEPPRRFEAAKMVKPWEGVHDATGIFPHCHPTAVPWVLPEEHPEHGSEDCLFLEVQTVPGATKGGAGTGLPVMVWIHGGGLQFGSANMMPWNASENVIVHAGGGVVVVKIQYRLNALGFLDHPALNQTNFGWRDQQLALRWVRAHIAAFGGDPGRVTIAGQSAGGTSVTFHLASPASRGLFAAAIAESAWTNPQTGNLPRASAQERGSKCAQALCKDAGDATAELACLRAVDVTALQANRDCTATVAGYDGDVLVEPLWRSVAGGRTHRVPLIIGGNTDEWNLFISLYGRTGASPAALARELGEMGAASRLADVYALYPADRYPNVSGVNGSSVSALTDMHITCPTRAFASGHASAAPARPVWRYLFSKAIMFKSDAANKEAREIGMVGAYHTLEMQYVFANWNGTIGMYAPTAADLALSSGMQDYWVSMTTQHRPVSSYSEWPDVAQPGKKGETRMLAFSDSGPSVVDAAAFRADKCAFWDKLYSDAFPPASR